MKNHWDRAPVRTFLRAMENSLFSKSDIVKLLVAMLMMGSLDHRCLAQNFLTTDPEFFKRAELERSRSAHFWTGRELPGRWSAPCPIEISIHSGPGVGVTHYQFMNGEVSGWKMFVGGSPEAILNDVIPHAVDRMVRASLLRKPIEPWLNEGCAALMKSAEARSTLREKMNHINVDEVTLEWLRRVKQPSDSKEFERLEVIGFSLTEYLFGRGSTQQLLQLQERAGDMSLRLQEVYCHPAEELLSHWRETIKVQIQSTNSAPDALNRVRPTLAIWTADWCSPCLKFANDFQHNDFFQQFLQTHFTLEFRSLEQHALEARQLGIHQVPTFVVRSSKRHLITGYQTPEALMAQLNHVMKTENISPFQVPANGHHSNSEPASTPVSPSTPPTIQKLFKPSQCKSYQDLSQGPETGVPLQEKEHKPSESRPEAAPKLEQAPSSASRQPVSPLRTHSGSARETIFSFLMEPALWQLLKTGTFIGGAAASGGVGGIAMALTFAFLKKRLIKSITGNSTSNNSIGNRTSFGSTGGAARELAPFPRELDEASQLLGLRKAEGRVAVLDTLRGLFLDDELEKLSQSSSPQTREIATQLRTSIDQRVDEVAPLSTTVTT